MLLPPFPAFVRADTLSGLRKPRSAPTLSPGRIARLPASPNAATRRSYRSVITASFAHLPALFLASRHQPDWVDAVGMKFRGLWGDSRMGFFDSRRPSYAG